MTRQHRHAPAVAENLPFSFAVNGYAGAGKSYTNLALLTGVARAMGPGVEVWNIDTDNRSQEYAKIFPHQRYHMEPPYSPADFKSVIQYCYEQGARVIGIDCMSDEHAGEGGVLDMRAKNPSKSLSAWTPIKEERKKMERYMRKLRDECGVVFGLTYRADVKYKPKSDDEKVREQTEGKPKDPTDHQWDIESTSDLPFFCSLRFLLPAGSDGVPLLKPTTAQERMLVKTTLTFEPYLKTIKQLNVDVGQRLYELAKGSARASSATQPSVPGRGPNFHRDYPGAKGPVNAASAAVRVAYLEWLVGIGGSGEAFENHCGYVQKLIEDDMAAEAERALEGAAE